MCQCTHIRCNNVPVTSPIVIKTVTSSFLTILHKGHFCSACSLYNIHHWTLCKKICLCTVADLLDFRKQLKTYFLKLLITMTFNFLVFNVFMECCNARVFVTGALEISRWWWWWQTPHVCTTHPFNGPLSRTTRVSRYQKVNQSGFYWSKRQWVAVASAGPYASLHLAPDR